jgi:hypothetical protein
MPEEWAAWALAWLWGQPQRNPKKQRFPVRLLLQVRFVKCTVLDNFFVVEFI